MLVTNRVEWIFPPLPDSSVFYLVYSHSARGVFVMSVCDVELSVYKKIFLKESRVLFMGLVRHYNSE